MQTGVVLVGEGASPGSPIPSGISCFNVTVNGDTLKEGAEVFALRLQSDDNCVCLGQSLALVHVQANGGILAIYTVPTQFNVCL